MKSLDDLLSQRAGAEFQEKLAGAMDPRGWTAENKDEKIAEARKIIEEITDQAVLFVQETIDKKIDGKSVLFWDVLNQMLTGKLEILLNLRDEMDGTPDVSLENLPIDYDWITKQIRETIKESLNIESKISRELSTEGTVESV